MYLGGSATDVARELLLDKAFGFMKKTRMDKLLLVKYSAYPFKDFFKGLEKNEAVRRIFGEKTEEVLSNLKVEFTKLGGYMFVNDRNGHLVINVDYLNSGNKTDIYLDVIHELVHIRQFSEGKELFDHNYTYAERPTEIEAYQFVVEEARRMGLSDERICLYLKTEWMTDEDLRRLTKAVGVECREKKKHPS